MTFTDDAWLGIADIRAAIDAHPFVAELREGALSLERFDHYLAQDALYLGDYGRALAAAAAQSSTADDLVFWSGAARETIVVERELHASHVEIATAAMSPTCAAYTSYLLRLATSGCYPELAAGVLPCFWIYEDVGTRLKDAIPDLAAHPYADWIATYGDPDFAESTARAKGIVDRLAEAASEAELARMHAAFRRAAQYEWMFWDAAYRRETWPIG